ncbi:hypothetical protein M408DRAFT_102625 [Serendipita vermifera MAFF 305830]|uniref:C2H2-type domain-containing protein n=1 Tax=Serendipita vermifera MAFF 305830 TaxID=933852 RepID=A0A0C3ANG8_SERVB|nr:hypothetical protein M408DRAFT_102625 [Serendipita vermifera MAFF 305830]
MEGANGPGNVQSHYETRGVSGVSFEQSSLLAGTHIDDSLTLEPTLRHFEHLKTNDPDLFKLLSKDVEELSHILDIITSDAPEIYVDGVRKYACVKCGTIHDRRLRANDCRYSDLGLKPYLCHGSCGLNSCKKSYSSKQLLNRHCEYDQVKKCGRCGRRQSKQNFARHTSSCQMQT